MQTLLKRLGILLLVLALTFSYGCGSEPVTDAPTTTQAPTTTESTTAPTEASTEPSSEPPSEPVTESVPTQTEPTQPLPTEPLPTEPSTEAPTDTTPTPTQEPSIPEITVVTPPDQKPSRPTEPSDPETDPTEPSTRPLPTEPPETSAPARPEPVEKPEPVKPSAGSFKIHFIDVGQADAALVQCDGKNMLIDGGNVGDSNLLYTYLKKQGVTRLDYVIGTHAHEDHIGGIAGALNYATVDTTFSPVTSYNSKAFSNFAKAAQKHGSSLTVPSVGEQFPLGSASCQIVGVNSTDETNNSSIVMRIVYGETTFLFTGDAELEAESIILSSGYELESTVLKVGHHGSDTSTSYRWLREVDPEYAVISVGKDNTYGHPTRDTLSRLRDADVTTFRTDLQGDIICTSDGKTVTFTTNRNAGVDVFEGMGGNSTQTRPDDTQDNSTEMDYVLNTNSMKFHYPTCSHAKRISAKNRRDYHGTREALIDDGYAPCGSCKP